MCLSYYYLTSLTRCYLLNYIALNVLFSAQIGLLCKLQIVVYLPTFLVLNFFPLHLRVKLYEANQPDTR